MRNKSLLVCGEGKHELGTPVANDGGVLEALLTRVSPTGWTVTERRTWKDVRLFRRGGGDPESRRVLGLAQRADETNCDVVVFARDTDDDPTREALLDRGIEQAGKAFPNVRIAGGAAVPCLEAWMLALCDVLNADRLNKRKAQERLLEKLGSVNLAAMVQVVERARQDTIDASSGSLRKWLDRARAALVAGDS